MNVLIVEAHTLLRESVRALISGWDAEAVVDDYASPEEAGAALSNNQYELIILKVDTRNIKDLNAVVRFSEIAPETPLVCLTDAVNHSIVRQLIQMGSRGVITSAMSSHEVVAVLQLILAGVVFIPSELIHNMVTDVDQFESDQATATTDSHLLINEVIASYGFSERQIEVLKHLWEGRPNKTISTMMDISINTVKAHLTSIFKILGVRNRTEAVSMLNKSAAHALSAPSSVSRVHR